MGSECLGASIKCRHLTLPYAHGSAAHTHAAQLPRGWRAASPKAGAACRIFLQAPTAVCFCSERLWRQQEWERERQKVGGREEKRRAGTLTSTLLHKQTHLLFLRNILWLDSCNLCRDRQHPTLRGSLLSVLTSHPPRRYNVLKQPPQPALEIATQIPAPHIHVLAPPHDAALFVCSRCLLAGGRGIKITKPQSAKGHPKCKLFQGLFGYGPHCPRPPGTHRGGTHRSVHVRHQQQSPADSSAELKEESHQTAFLSTGCTAYKIMF